LDETPKGCNYSEQIISTIKSYVQEHYQDVTLEDVAELVHLNPYYLSKFFKEKTGENYSDLVMAVRMKKAAELLRDFSYRTYQISEMVGYSNPKNFTRTFKRYFGKTPREFRNYQV
jgi:YesN/AraC family two-component response regulator